MNSAYVLNTNTNYIFKLINNPNKSQKNKNNYKLSKIYARVKYDGTINYQKTFSISNVNKYLSQNYFIRCNSYIHAQYCQALSRMEKHKDNPENYNDWCLVALKIQTDFPEELI